MARKIAVDVNRRTAYAGSMTKRPGGIFFRLSPAETERAAALAGKVPLARLGKLLVLAALGDADAVADLKTEMDIQVDIHQGKVDIHPPPIVPRSGTQSEPLYRSRAGGRALEYLDPRDPDRSRSTTTGLNGEKPFAVREQAKEPVKQLTSTPTSAPKGALQTLPSGLIIHSFVPVAIVQRLGTGRAATFDFEQFYDFCDYCYGRHGNPNYKPHGTFVLDLLGTYLDSDHRSRMWSQPAGWRAGDPLPKWLNYGVHLHSGVYHAMQQHEAEIYHRKDREQAAARVANNPQFYAPQAVAAREAAEHAKRAAAARQAERDRLAAEAKAAADWDAKHPELAAERRAREKAEMAANLAAEYAKWKAGERNPRWAQYQAEIDAEWRAYEQRLQAADPVENTGRGAITDLDAF